MSMLNLLEYNNNYSMTSRSLWNYYRDKVNDDAHENNDNNNYRINNGKTTTSKHFEFKTKIMGRTPGDDNILDTEVVVPLKYWCNFCGSLNLPLINCEMELNLMWPLNSIIYDISRKPEVGTNPGANPSFAHAQTTATNASFQMNSAKFYIPIVTLSINDDIKFLEKLKQQFKRTIFGDKYRSK